MDVHKLDRPRAVNTPTEQRRGDALTIRRCVECEKLLAPMVVTCTVCQSMALEPVISSGEGSIVSWKVVHRPTNNTGSDEWETATIAIVELDDGPWIYTTIEGEVPQPSGRPVRVKFKPESTGDRFPVFTTHTTDGAHPSGSGGPQSRCTDARTGSKSTAETTKEKTHDSTWVRSCMHQCDFLAAAHSLDNDARASIRFAITWAPFGGASADELLMTFGVTRWRFVQRVREFLQPRAGDTRNERTIKQNLLEAVSWGWRMYPDSSAARP